MSSQLARPSSSPFSPRKPTSSSRDWSTSPSPVPLPIDLYTAPQAKGRQQKFVESLAQRKQRVEFLRRREWTRRIAEWIDSSTSADTKALASITYSWVDILAAADADDDFEDAASGSAPCALSPYPHEEPDCTEPYVIYTASPRSSPASHASSHSFSYTPPASPARPPALYPAPLSPSPAPPVHRLSTSLPRSRHSSLSSISEEDEPTPCS